MQGLKKSIEFIIIPCAKYLLDLFSYKIRIRSNKNKKQSQKDYAS